MKTHRKPIQAAALLLALLLAFTLLPAQQARAAPLTLSVVAINNIDVDASGSVTADGVPMGALGPGDILRLTGTNATTVITVNNFDAHIQLDNLTALRMEIKSATVTIDLVGSNTLDASAAAGKAGLRNFGGHISITSGAGGSLTATGGDFAAGIGGSEFGNSHYITIQGNAQVTANGGLFGAGIGSGAGVGIATGHITIEGSAVVTANGGISGAGIGGGHGGDSGNITIGGSAHITATGDGGGAGIGGGDSGGGGTVTIQDNATVNAQGGGNANGGGAGIGGGVEGAGAAVTISGGTVNATGGQNGAGIGGGSGFTLSPNSNGGDGGTANISGGHVTAVGDGKAAGIGGGGTDGAGGLGGGSASDSITGGVVIAQAGAANPGEDIGPGLGGNGTNKVVVHPAASVTGVGSGIQIYTQPQPQPTPQPNAGPSQQQPAKETAPLPVAGGSTGDVKKEESQTGYLAPVLVGYGGEVPVLGEVKGEALPKGRAKLTINASGSSRLLYQWQVQGEDGGWRNVGGANGSVYTARGLKAGKEYAFRCVVSSFGGGQAVSEAVKVAAAK